MVAIDEVAADGDGVGLVAVFLHVALGHHVGAAHAPRLAHVELVGPIAIVGELLLVQAPLRGFGAQLFRHGVVRREEVEEAERVVGVLGGLEAIRALQRSGFRPQRSIELLVFTSEEPTRFGIGCLGSRLLSGALSATKASTLTDSDGQDVDKVRRQAGFSGELRDVQLPSNYFHAFVELHIEQGPLLERQGLIAPAKPLGA